MRHLGFSSPLFAQVLEIPIAPLHDSHGWWGFRVPFDLSCFARPAINDQILLEWFYVCAPTAYQHPVRLLFLGSGAPSFLGRGMTCMGELLIRRLREHTSSGVDFGVSRRVCERLKSHHTPSSWRIYGCDWTFGQGRPFGWSIESRGRHAWPWQARIVANRTFASSRLAVTCHAALAFSV